MSPWLRPRLLVLFCGSLFVGGATTYLQAQENVLAPASSPEEAATRFWKLLDRVHRPEKFAQYDTDSKGLGSLYGSVVEAQFEALGRSDQSQRVLNLVATEAFSPTFEMRTQGPHSNGGTIVSVIPDTVPRAREVVVVREAGGYRVDMVATYGRWSGLKGLEADKALYRATKWISPALARQSDFVGTRTQDQCQANLKQVALAVMMYSQDYDEQLPPARKWKDVVAVYTPYGYSQEVFTCPAVIPKQNGYAFNVKMSQLPIAEIRSPAQVLQLYETSITKPNVFAPFTGRAYRHSIADRGSGMNIGFADGHVKWFKRGEEGGVGLSPTADYDKNDAFLPPILSGKL